MTSSNLRTCVVCRKKAIQAELNRFTLSNEEYLHNFDNKIQGRSIYVHDECLTKFRKRAKKYNINKDVIDKIIDGRL